MPPVTDIARVEALTGNGVEFLEHYGVKGMHWGQRKAESIHPDYSTGMQRYDESQHGKGSVERINRRMNAGSTIGEARQAETKFRNRRTTAIVGALVLTKILIRVGPVLAGNIAVRAETKRGENTINATIKRNSTLTPKNKKGVYNITTK